MIRIDDIIIILQYNRDVVWRYWVCVCFPEW
jgi:hypothetical protein